MDYSYALDFKCMDHDVFDNVEEVVEYFVDEILQNFFDDFEYETNVIRKGGVDYMDIKINKLKPYEDDLNAKEIVEIMSDEAYQESGCEEYLQDVDTTWLQEQLSKIWKQWKEKECIGAPFYQIVECKTYRVCLEDGNYICLS